MPRRDWSREELIVAFNLYCKIPFGRIHIRTPVIKELAKALGRTPSAVSWKLANFARLDPALKKRHIKGASHGAHSEIEIWNEFNNDWERLAFESERLLARMYGGELEIAKKDGEFPEGKTRESLIRSRVNQGFFRDAVLAAYDGRCCITGLSIPELLNASHIIPWSVDSKNRTNPCNGLCLNAIHDRAFDCGLLTITPKYEVRLSRRLSSKKDPPIRQIFQKYQGSSISLPRRFLPDPNFLRYHNERIFVHE